MSEIKLKACPFCGERAEILSIVDDDLEIPVYAATCGVCGRSMAEWSYTPEEAAKAWNRRAYDWHKWPEEKPTKEDIVYLVTYEGMDNVYFDEYSKGIWNGESMPDVPKILAWREMPEPWEENDNE